MTRTRLRHSLGLLLLAIGLLAAAPGWAQTVQARVVASCGTPPATPAVGVITDVYEDQTGKLCVVTAGGGGGGTSSTFGAAFPTAGTAIGLSFGGNMVAGNADASGNLLVDLATALPAGANDIGSVDQHGTWNITNISGTVSLPTGAATSALQTTGNTALTTINTTLGSPFQAGGALGAGSAIIGNVRIDQTTPGTTNGVQVNAALPAGSNTIGAVTTLSGGCAGQSLANTNFTPISVSSAVSTKLVAGVGGQNVYICHVELYNNAADNVAFISGTKVTTECDTSTAGLNGGTTAAAGANLGANSGFIAGDSAGAIMKTASTGKDVCLITSAATQLSGVVVWAQF